MKHLKSLLTIVMLAIAVAGVTEIALAQKKVETKVCRKCGQHYKGAHNCPKDKKPEPKPKSEPKPKAEPKLEPKSKPEPNRPKGNPTPRVPQRSASEIINDYVNSMVYVEGGTFTMGATSEQGSDAYNWEKPAHSVALSSFYIGKTEVTQELWQAVMGSNPSEFKGAKRPVENVSWDDCQEFISKLNQKTGKQFRLPTEAEWEYAARGGNSSQGYKYSGSNSVDDVAWYEDNSGSTTHEVATKRANELGLYDMSGNVLEWCSDWYGSYSSSAQTNPTGPSSGSNRVLRGGSWRNLAGSCRVSDRKDFSPGFRFHHLGLRLAL